MNETLSLIGFAFLLSFYPTTLWKIYTTRDVSGYAISSFLCLFIGCGILTYTAYVGAAYWPFVLGNFLNWVGATWVLILCILWKDS